VAAIAKHDADRNGTLSLNEFAKVCEQLKQPAAVDEEVRRVFTRYDYDRSGQLSKSELRGALRDMKIDMMAPETVAAIAKHDADRIGTLSLNDFAKVCEQLKQPAAVDEEVRRVFTRYDYDRSGQLSKSELRGALRDMKIDMMAPEAVAAIAKHDADRNGTLSLGEFAKVCEQLKPKSPPISEETKKVFNRYDFDRSGQLSKSELRSALRELRIDVSTPEAVATIAKYDADQNGALSLEEFAQVCAKLQPPPPKPREMASVRNLDADIKERQASVFRKYDRNRDGSLDKQELRSALAELDLDLSGDQAAAALQKFDADGSGSLGVQEFSRLASMLAAVASDAVIQVFKRFDANGTGALDRQELEAALKHMGVEISSKEVGAAIRRVDGDGNGRLDLPEFARLCKSVEPGPGSIRR
jgi:Ca2+-binding EF-hand superfamily protein